VSFHDSGVHSRDLQGLQAVELHLVKASRARHSRGRHWRWSWGFVTIIVLFENSTFWNS
jgi:hypothetical protein